MRRKAKSLYPWWSYKQEKNGPPLEHRLKTEEILTAAKQVGFSSVETIQLQYMVLFRLTIWIHIDATSIVTPQI